VEKGDILTLAGGLIIVLVIAIIANPQNISGIRSAVVSSPPTVTQTPYPIQTVIPTRETPVLPVLTPATTPRDVPPYQIFYTDKPFQFPVFKLPENMEIYGASDVISRNQEMVTFAFVDDKRGGITQKFSVPYPLWIMNITVTANTTPQYGKFRMALCHAANGTIIEGEEILNRGNSYRLVQTSNTDMYMIISTSYIDNYHISLEAPRKYYDMYRPR
jgi:hypothetical protein